MSLRQMLELNAVAFVSAVSGLIQLKAEADLQGTAADVLTEQDRDNVVPRLEAVTSALRVVDARSAIYPAERLFARLSEEPLTITHPQVLRALEDIESRFNDHLDLVTMFVMTGDEPEVYRGGAAVILGHETADRFPSARYDADEAARCLCLGRILASVFHAMKMLEFGIRAVARALDIEDPTKGNERNWARVIKTIKEAIDEQYPPSLIPDPVGQRLLSIVTCLDLIRVAWRNDVMHASGVYTDAEARHIVTSAGNLLKQVAELFDENGESVAVQA